MSRPSLDDLRTQLRELGYLTHGLERWFALDPWSSRTFWQELFLVAAKAAALIAPFGVLPMLAVMLLRNDRVAALDTAILAASYLAIAAASIFVLVVLTGLVLKFRPAAGIDQPLLLSAASLGLAIVVAAGIGIWWLGFGESAAGREWAVLAPLVVLLVAVGTIVFSAALLSFSIHESRRIPVVARSSRSAPILLIGGAMLLLMVVAGRVRSEPAPADPPYQVVTTPSSARVALVGVDGLSRELLEATPELRDRFASASEIEIPQYRSAAERWASIGTGTPRELHRVRSVEGIRLGGASSVLQAVSRFDPLRLAPARWLGLARGQPLPSTVRDREYVWEIVGGRGTPAVAVNWWVSPAGEQGALRTIGQQKIFAGAAGEGAWSRPLEIDRTAADALLAEIDRRDVRFSTVYLPALDILLNRLGLPEERKLPASLAAIEGVRRLVAELLSRGLEVILVGAPGEGRGRGVLASTVPLEAGDAFDLAPTLLALMGFPASEEMPGEPLIDGAPARIASYGTRRGSPAEDRPVDQEYYEALRSLGYVR